MAKPSTSLLKRRLDIAEIVRKNGEMKVDDLAEMLAVSGVTIRNDLNYLEQQGYLKRSFGGAIYTSQAGTPIALAQEAPVVTDKALETEMARQIAAQIEDSETLFLGQGSILRKVIPFLAGYDELCLLLNDLAHVPLAQCAIFSFESPNRPRTVAMGDRSRTSALPRIAQSYVTRFFRLDPVLAVMQAFAPTIVHAVRLHHTGNTLHQDLGDLMLARATRRCLLGSLQ